MTKKTFGAWLMFVSVFTFGDGLDIPAFEAQLDETIQSACHSYLVDMLPESWQQDVYDATERCRPVSSDDAFDGSDQRPSSPSDTNAPDLGPRVDRHYAIRNACQNEYMCVEQRIKWTEKGIPITQAEYDQVSTHCEGRYTCIEAFFLDWPKPLPEIPTAASTGLSFSALMESESQAQTPTSAQEMPDQFVDQRPDKISESAGNTLGGFAGLQAHRDQRERTEQAQGQYRELSDEVKRKSLTSRLKKACKQPRLSYYTPASPSSIRRDMRDMQDEFERFVGCYTKQANAWDAQAYVDALAELELRKGDIEQQYQTSLKSTRGLQSVEQQFAKMNQTIEKKTARLNDQLEEGPRWIESLYASGTFQRPNSGPSAMAIMSQVLSQVNADLNQQRRQSERALQQTIQQLTAPKVSVPTYQQPKIPTPSPVQVDRAPIPSIVGGSQSRASVQPQAQAQAQAQAQVQADPIEQFACFSLGLQICIHYKMPSSEIKAYQQRCARDGNRLLERCSQAPSCLDKNFAGEIRLYDYDVTDMDRFKRQCDAGNGTFFSS